MQEEHWPQDGTTGEHTGIAYRLGSRRNQANLPKYRLTSGRNGYHHTYSEVKAVQTTPKKKKKLNPTFRKTGKAATGGYDTDGGVGVDRINVRHATRAHEHRDGHVCA